jgi:hypothetical protein
MKQVAADVRLIEESGLIAKAELDTTLACHSVVKINTKGGRDSRLMLITELRLALFTVKKGFRRTCSLSRQFQWINATSFQLPKPNQVHLVFKDGFVSFLDDEANDILIGISQHCLSIFTEFEFSRSILDFDGSLLSRLERKRDSLIRRIRFRCLSDNRPFPSSFYKTLETSLERVSTGNSFDLNRFLDHWDLMDVLFDGFNSFPELQELIIPKASYGHSFWNFLPKFVGSNVTINTLTICDSPPDLDKFRLFVDSFQQNSRHKIQNLSFCDISIDSGHSSKIGALIDSRPMESLSIINGFTSSGYQTFRSLVSGSGFQDLVKLTIQGYSSIDVQHFTSMRLKHLDLSNSELDLCNILHPLDGKDDLRLIELTVSGNRSESPLNVQVQLPRHLRTIIADRVHWSNDNLEHFFIICGNVSEPIRVSLKDTYQLTGQWSSFTTFLTKFDRYPFSGLSFDRNELKSGFIDYVRRCNQLSYLSVRGCFSEKDEMLVPFGDMIISNKTIDTLDIGGEGIASMKSSISVLLTAVGQNTSILNLNVTGNNVGNGLFDLLYNLLVQNRTLQSITFDDNQLDNLDSFRVLISKLKSQTRTIKLQLPKHDLLRLTERKDVKLGMVLDADSSRRELSLIESELRTLEGRSVIDGHTTKNAGVADSNSVPSLSNGGSKPPVISRRSMNRAVSSAAVTQAHHQSLPSTVLSGRVSNPGEVPFEEVYGDVVINAPVPAETVLDPVQQLAVDSVNEEYVLDNQWESLLEDLPVPNLDGLLSEIEHEFQTTTLLKWLPKVSS